MASTWRTTIDYGIDLGARDSCIAVLEGTQARLIKNDLDMDFTPSAVWITKRGELSVGQRARQRLVAEPENAYTEFKLQMGSSTQYRFAHSGRTMRPEELSAEVLKSLRADVQRSMGEDLRAAVITVPAAFELPQCEATQKAAKLAGLKLSPLIMEPTAAAMAHAFQSKADGVFWLVYDFGGGTFDAAVIRLKEGTFQLVNHAGDNELGGKLLDWDIVNKILAPAVAKDHRLTDFRLGNPRWRLAFAKLKWAAEDAKIDLSKKASSEILIDFLCDDEDGQPMAFEHELKRDEVTALAAPYIRRSVNIARKALADAHLGPGDIEKIILVGGSTKAPCVGDLLADPKEGLGISVDSSFDPQTVIVQGAAVFAGTQPLPAELRRPAARLGVLEVGYQLEPAGIRPEPRITGSVVAPAGQDLSGFTIEFINADSKPAWRSGRVALNGQGAFQGKLWARPGRINAYRIEVCDADGNVRPCSPDSLTYGLRDAASTAAGELNHSIGILFPDNQVQVILPKGTPWPVSRSVPLDPARTIMVGVKTKKFIVALVEGESSQPGSHRLIGRLDIPAKEWLWRPPRWAGSPWDIEVKLRIEVDANRLATASVYIPLRDREFEQVLDLEGVASPVEGTKRRRGVAVRRSHKGGLTRDLGKTSTPSVLAHPIGMLFPGGHRKILLQRDVTLPASAYYTWTFGAGAPGNLSGDDGRLAFTVMEYAESGRRGVGGVEILAEDLAADMHKRGEEEVALVIDSSRWAWGSLCVRPSGAKYEKVLRLQGADLTPVSSDRHEDSRPGVKEARERGGLADDDIALAERFEGVAGLLVAASAALAWREAARQGMEQAHVYLGLLPDISDLETRNRIEWQIEQVTSAIQSRDIDLLLACSRRLETTAMKYLLRRRVGQDRS